MSGQRHPAVVDHTLTRRRLLGLGAGLTGLTAVGLAGCSGLLPSPQEPMANREQPRCVARSSLTSYRQVADLPLVYEVTQRRTAFAAEPGFADQLAAWLTDLRERTAWPLDQLWTYGTWTDGGTTCSSWHDAGRAFDLSRLRLDRRTFVSARYDQWRERSGAQLRTARRSYWAVAASAHKHFAYVLTYLYNAQHHNHIHVDNGRSGPALSTFSSRSAAQVQAVQGICSHLWDSPVEITGSWNGPTRDAVRQVLDGLDVGDDLTDRPTWTAFLDASTRRGADPA
ncbi:MAG TPA: extensin family protein [Microlunatus sp.]|nr:extensin family protein [Microlunatus sp.]